MARESNQKLKLYRLMQIMLEETDEEHSLTMNDILDRLAGQGIKAERKSIYSDMAGLEALGVEVMGEKDGKEYRYRVVDRPFELAEVKLLIDSIQASRFITSKKSGELINKLKKQVSRYEASSLQRQVYINDRIKTMNESIYYSVDAIHNAIAANRQIRFLYCSWNASGELVPRHDGEFYRVSPWALAWADENYYLVAYDLKAGKVKHYRVDKMMKISMADERREGRELFDDFDMGRYASQNFGMYGGEVMKVHIEFPEHMAGVFIDRFGKDVNIRKLADDRCEVSVNVAVSLQFAGWIFGLGSDVKITSPEAVISMVREEARKFSANYE